MSQVMKVSKAGHNVLTATDANLSFSSELASHSIYNVVTLSKPSPDTSVTYNHNLGYVPKVWVFISLNDGADYYRRVPQMIAFDRVDYTISSTAIVISTDATAAKTFRVIIFTRSPNP
jgi:hypothetical protein